MRIFGICVLCLVAGCSFTSRHSAADGVRGQVVRPEILTAGGTVRIIPFSPGVRAAASEELDTSAVIMVRGIMDGLNADGRRFQVQDVGDSAEPDLMITGYIQRMGTSGGWKRYVGGSRRRFVDVQGKVCDRKGNPVAVFQHRVQARYQDMSQQDLMLKVGRDIGEFLVRNY